MSESGLDVQGLMNQPEFMPTTVFEQPTPVFEPMKASSETGHETVVDNDKFVNLDERSVTESSGTKPPEHYLGYDYARKMKRPSVGRARIVPKRARRVGKYFQCFYCEFEHITLKEILLHTATMHDIVECAKCGKRFPFIGDALEHFEQFKFQESCENFGATGNIKCSKCPLVFTTLGRYRQHLKKQHEIYFCWRCNDTIVFNTERELWFHIVRVHDAIAGASINQNGDLVFKCTACNEQFSEYKNLHSHVRFAHGTAGVQDEDGRDGEADSVIDLGCVECGNRFSSLGALRMHEREVHGMDVDTATNGDDDLVECDRCQRKFTRLGYVRKHRQICLAKNPRPQPQVRPIALGRDANSRASNGLNQREPLSPSVGAGIEAAKRVLIARGHQQNNGQALGNEGQVVGEVEDDHLSLKDLGVGSMEMVSDPMEGAEPQSKFQKLELASIPIIKIPRVPNLGAPASTEPDPKTVGAVPRPILKSRAMLAASVIAKQRGAALLTAPKVDLPVVSRVGELPAPQKPVQSGVTLPTTTIPPEFEWLIKMSPGPAAGAADRSEKGTVVRPRREVRKPSRFSDPSMVMDY